jgi:hypothetical protein
MLEKARSVLPQDTVRFESQSSRRQSESSRISERLRIGRHCVPVLQTAARTRPTEPAPVLRVARESFSASASSRSENSSVEQAALKNDDATKAFLLDWQRLCFVPLDLDPLTERIIEPFFLYELSVLKELKSSSDAKRFRTATDRILLSLSDVVRRGIQERTSASYLSTSDSCQYPISAILFLDNVLTYAGQLSAKLHWDEIIFKLEILCEDDLLRNKQEFENKGVVYDRLFDKFNIHFEYYWVPELLMKRNCTSLSKKSLICTSKPHEKVRSETILDERKRAFYIARMINNLVLLAKVLQKRVHESEMLHERPGHQKQPHFDLQLVSTHCQPKANDEYQQSALLQRRIRDNEG